MRKNKTRRKKKLFKYKHKIKNRNVLLFVPNVEHTVRATASLITYQISKKNKNISFPRPARHETVVDPARLI